MTIWIPDLESHSGPKYRAIAETLARDIDSGLLATGDRLPTHRDLAWRLGVTVGTVSRAYALAQEQGLIAGEVGRGTVVCRPAVRQTAAPLQDPAGNSPIPAYFASALGRHVASGIIEMGRSYPSDRQTAEIMAQALRRMAVPELLQELGGYHPPNGLPVQRQAAVAWLGEQGVSVDEGTVLIANGCQNALAIAMMAVCKPGDRILMEELAWPGAAHLAQSLGLTIGTIALDREGIRPDALDEACREGAARLLYTVPTLQNPTTATMSEQRRRDIVEVARKHGLILVEDGVFSFLSPDAPMPLHALAPDITIYATSLSKAVTPALRIGYLAVPEALVSPLATVIKTTMLMPATLGAQLASELIFSGAAALAAKRQREIATDRQDLARRIFGERAELTNPDSSHLWMQLPPQWNAPQFADAAMARGVSVNPGNSFMAVPATGGPSHIRVCLSTENDRQRIEEGLRIVSELFASHPTAEAAIV